MTSHNRNKPLRLAQVFQAYKQPLYFVTFNAWKRQRIFDCDVVHDAFIKHCQQVLERGVSVGRYVIMPDHIHIFVRIAPGLELGETIKYIKQAITKILHRKTPELRVWQPGFFDHLLRNSDSYSDKWNYVSNNPVRAGLVEDACEWKYQGEIVCIRDL